MANAQAEKLKALGLRHGEKVVVGLVALLTLFFVYKSATKESIQITPDEVRKDAQAAQSNLSKAQPAADILAKIEAQGIKDPGFVAMVEAQEKDKLDPKSFPVARNWVSPEPGAGLIRDMPELIAATDLAAYPGRGGALLFALDENFKRIPEDPAEKKAEDEATKQRRSRKGPRRRGGPASSTTDMPMPGNPAEMTEEQKKEAERIANLRKRSVVGEVPTGEPTQATATPEGGPYKEITQGLRWVAITGVVDHKTLRENYLKALKNPASQPNYKQLNVERQVKQPDGSWSDWEAVDAEHNRLILDNLPEEEEEMVTPDKIIPTLVDPLPFLKAGYWERVHVASLVPKEKLAEPNPNAAMGMGMPGSSAGPGAMGMPGSSAGPGAMGMPGSSTMMGDYMPGMGGGMMGGGGGAENTNYPKTDADTIMIRSLDFTAEPDTTYRYRVQIVVFNPNLNREDVSPGVNTKDLELKGPWSEPTGEVTMPADVTAYVMRKTPSGPNAKRSDTVSFQVVKWNPENGMTTYRNMDYGLGEIVGEVRTTRIPDSEGNGTKSLAVDYNSHQLLIDEAGGERPLAPVQIGGVLDVPAVSLLLRPDGSVMVRNEAFDLADPVRKDIKANYDREVEESDKNKKRESSNGMMSAGPR